MKKSKITPVFILILFTVLFTIIILENKQEVNKIPEIPEVSLQKSFDASGAKIVSSEIYFWSKLDNKNKSIESLKKLTSDLLIGLGINGSNLLSKSYDQNDLIQKVELRGITVRGKIADIKIQLGRDKTESTDSFVSVSVSEDLSNTGLEEVRNAVVTVFANNKLSPKINSCMTGFFDGKLEQNQLEGISRKVLEEVKAVNVEGIRDNNLISVSAYSPLIKESVKVKGSKINLNLAIRYNSNENKTYIWLATPIIITEY